MPEGEKLSDRLERWLRSNEPKTIGSLIELFREKSFAVLFVLLLAVPALPLPTGGVTHVFEVIAMLLALELIVGRRQVWLPERWWRRELGAADAEALRRDPAAAHPLARAPLAPAPRGSARRSAQRASSTEPWCWRSR